MKNDFHEAKINVKPPKLSYFKNRFILPAKTCSYHDHSQSEDSIWRGFITGVGRLFYSFHDDFEEED